MNKWSERRLTDILFFDLFAVWVTCLCKKKIEVNEMDGPMKEKLIFVDALYNPVVLFLWYLSIQHVTPLVSQSVKPVVKTRFLWLKAEMKQAKVSVSLLSPLVPVCLLTALPFLLSLPTKSACNVAWYACSFCRHSVSF